MTEYVTYNLYSGNCLYFSNSSCHSASERGGFIPEITFHSVIDSPLSVSRVRPPTTTMVYTKPALKYSQYATTGLVTDTAPVVRADEASAVDVAAAVENRFFTMFRRGCQAENCRAGVAWCLSTLGLTAEVQ